MSTTIKPRTTVVTLFQGDDHDRLAELHADVVQAATVTEAKRLGDDLSVTSAAAKYDEALAEAIERGVQITLQALGRKVWRDLLVKHPARTETVTDADGKEVSTPNAADMQYGFNVEAMADDLVPASIAPGQFDSTGERDNFLDSLADGDFSRLYSAAVPLNQSAGPDPKARLSSRLGQTSSETSESPARLG